MGNNMNCDSCSVNSRNMMHQREMMYQKDMQMPRNQLNSRNMNCGCNMAEPCVQPRVKEHCDDGCERNRNRCDDDCNRGRDMLLAKLHLTKFCALGLRHLQDVDIL